MLDVIAASCYLRLTHFPVLIRTIIFVDPLNCGKGFSATGIKFNVHPKNEMNLPLCGEEAPK
jgi:hypothetical protein